MKGSEEVVRLIVSDLDGTLMPYGQAGLSDGIRARIQKALDKNIAFAVSSGRTYGELAALLPEFEDKIWFICCDGAYYVHGGKTYGERRVEPSDLGLFFGVGASAVFHGAFENYSVGDDLHREAARFAPKPVARATEIREKIYKVTTYGREILSPACSGLRVHWDGSCEGIAQYVNRFANKGTALSDLQMRLMLTKFDTACIGDGGNDVAMMKNAKYSFAVGNCPSELAEAAAYRVQNAEQAFDMILN